MIDTLKIAGWLLDLIYEYGLEDVHNNVVFPHELSDDEFLRTIDKIADELKIIVRLEE